MEEQMEKLQKQAEKLSTEAKQSAEPKPHLRVLPGSRMLGKINQSLFCYNREDVPPAVPLVAVYLYEIPADAELLAELGKIRDEMQKKIWGLAGTSNYTVISREITPDVVRLLEKSGTKKALLEFPRIKSGMYIYR